MGRNGPPLTQMSRPPVSPPPPKVDPAYAAQRAARERKEEQPQQSDGFWGGVLTACFLGGMFGSGEDA